MERRIEEEEEEEEEVVIKTQTQKQSECEYCNEQRAVVYCRADNAKLCLICDQHVHSANTLSKKHVRSQICNHCYESPVTLHCFTHNMSLCQDCDFNIHSLSNNTHNSNHDRTPIEGGITGCPTPLELASYWGFDLYNKTPFQLPSQMPLCFDDNDAFFDWSEFVVPGHHKPRDQHGVGKQQQQLVVIDQLIELHKRDNGGGERDDVAGVPVDDVDGYVAGVPVDDVDGLVGLVNDDKYYEMVNVLNSETNGGGIVGVNNDQSYSNPTSQIWDFNSGQMRRHKEESRQLDQDLQGGGVISFIMNNYGALVRESELATSNVLGDVNGLKCSNTRDDIRVFNSNSHKPTASHGPAATSENNNKPITRPSSSINFGDSKQGLCNDVQFIDQSLYLGIDSARRAVKTQANLEVMAQNRGSAMQRYKEKKKTRRFDQHVRYESRKARAETRKRVKGRFVKSFEA